MQDWLKNKNIAYGEGDTIPQLLLKVKMLDVLKMFESNRQQQNTIKKSKKMT